MPEYRPMALRSPESRRDCPRKGDALMTDQPGLLLSIRTADCMPILLVDPKRRALAAVHAGWRGALERIVEKSVGDMRRLFASRPSDLLVAIGPSIRVCCYEVGEEVRENFSSRFAKSEDFFQNPAQMRNSLATRVPRLSTALTPLGHQPENISPIHLDLIAVARYQLESAGVLPSHVQVAEFCTSCRTDLFFSHRKEGSATGRMLAVVGIRPAK
jgi:YfiH family protein